MLCRFGIQRDDYAACSEDSPRIIIVRAKSWRLCVWHFTCWLSWRSTPTLTVSFICLLVSLVDSMLPVIGSIVQIVFWKLATDEEWRRECFVGWLWFSAKSPSHQRTRSRRQHWTDILSCRQQRKSKPIISVFHTSSVHFFWWILFSLDVWAYCVKGPRSPAVIAAISSYIQRITNLLGVGLNQVL